MADVVIVGGGISGVAAAYELALMQVDTVSCALRRRIPKLVYA